jgi:hypothetical protein
MSLQVGCRCVFLALVFVVLVGPAQAQQAKQDEEIDLNDLSLEINALQTLNTLNLTDDQLLQLQSWAPQTVQKGQKREAAKASKEYRDKLVQLRAALLDASDADKIDQLYEEVDELRDAEKPTVDDGVELSASARKKAPAVLKLLKVQQLTAYLAALNDDLGDPLDRLLNALPSIRSIKGDEWKQRRAEIVDEIVRQAAGVDSAKAEKLDDQITALLSQAHSMTDAEFKAKQPGLEKTARELLGDIGPLDLVRLAVERGLAELLSNPRLTVVLNARLKKGG